MYAITALSDTTVDRLTGLSAVTVAILAGLALLAVWGIRRATADVDVADADADRLRRLRIQADDEVWRTTTGFDTRTAELVVDPTLKAADVAEMVHHVAPGEGSVVSVADEAGDTKLRTLAQVAELLAAEVEAYTEAVAREADVVFAAFDAAMREAFARIDRLQAAVSPWSFYQHDDEGARCPHCAEDIAAVSGEYRQIVAAYDTSAWDVRELRAALAAA
jgi:hypothetical protein